MPWLAVEPLVNTPPALVVFIWSQTGLAMVILSAAVKAVPTEQIEAAELDGANAWQRFRNVTRSRHPLSIVVVVTTIAIGALKVYDIVAVMTGGRANSTVLAFEMVNQQQRFQSYGHSAALAVVLFIFVDTAHRLQRRPDQEAEGDPMTIEGDRADRRCAAPLARSPATPASTRRWRRSA